MIKCNQDFTDEGSTIISQIPPNIDPTAGTISHPQEFLIAVLLGIMDAFMVLFLSD